MDLGAIQARLVLNISNFSANLNAAEQEIHAAENRFSGFKQVGERFEKIGKSLTMGVTLPIVGLGVAAVKASTDFEAQMSRVKAISGATGDDFQKLNDQAMKLGADTSFSAKEAAEGMENMASAGFNVNEIMQAMPGMLDLAASGGVEIAQASDIAASTLRGFGIEASQAGHVADVMARAASDTNAGILDMGEAMKYVAPVSHAMGISLEETSAAIGLMSNAGIKGSQAGTTLRGALTRLANPSKEAADKMKSLGFNAFDTQGKMKSLADNMESLKDKTKNLTDQQKQQAIAEIFGQEAMSGMIVLMEQGKPKIDELTNSFKNCDGASAEMAKVMQDNLKGAVEQMGGSLETAGIKIGNALTPTIRSIAEKITDLTNKFSELDSETQNSIVKFSLLAASVGPAISIFGELMGSVTAIAGGFKTLSALCGITSLATAGVGTAGTAAAGGVAAVGTAVTGATATLAPWILGIGAAAFGLYKLVKYLRSDCVPAVDIFANKFITDNRKVEDSFKKLDSGVKVSMKDMNSKVSASAVNSGKELVKISDSTKKALGAYMELDKKAGTSLLSLQANNAKITSNISADMRKNVIEESKKIATDMQKTTGDMVKQIVSGLEKHKGEAHKTMQGFFKDAKDMTDKEKLELAQKFDEGYNNQQQKAKAAGEKLIKIYQSIADNGGRITDEQAKEINKCYQDMEQQAVQALSQSQLEQQAIFEGIKSNATRLSDEQASDVIKSSAKQRDESITNANDQCKKVIAELIYQRDVTGDLSKEEAQKRIDEAERQRKESVTKAEEMHRQVVYEVGRQCEDVGKKIDEKSGEIKHAWQRIYDWFNEHVIHPKVETSGLGANANGDYGGGVSIGDDGGGSQQPGLRRYASGTDNAERGINEVAEDGFEIVAKRGFRWFEGGEKVFNHEDSKKLLSSLAGVSNAGNLGGEAKQQAKIWGADLCQGFSDGLNQNSGLVSDGALTVANGIYRLLHFSKPDEGPLSRFEEWMPDFAQGLAKGLEDNTVYVNNAAVKLGSSLAEAIMPERNIRATYFDLISKGTMSVEKAFVDLDGIIEKLKVSTGDYEIDNRNLIGVMTHESTEINILTNEYNRLGQVYGYNSKEALEVLKKIQDLRVEYQNTGKEVMELANNFKQKQIDSINDVTSKVKESLKERYSEEQKVEEKRLNTIKDNKVKELEYRLKWLDEKKSQHQIENQDAEDSEKEKQLRQMIGMNYSKKKKEEMQNELNDLLKSREERKYQEDIEAQKASLQKQIDQENENCTKQLANIQEFYEDKLRESNINAEAEKLVVSNNQKDIVNLLHSYGKDYEIAGQTLGDRLADGFKIPIENIKGMLSSLSQSITQVQNATLVPSIGTPQSYGNVTTNNNTSSAIQNNYGSLLHADNISIEGYKDTRAFAEELEFYRNQANKGRGGGSLV